MHHVDDFAMRGTFSMIIVGTSSATATSTEATSTQDLGPSTCLPAGE